MCVCVCVHFKRLILIAPRPKVAWSPNFAYPQNPRTGICRYLARNSTTLPSGGNRASSCSNWRKVWNGVKCNFSLAQHQNQNVNGKLSISRLRIWIFTRIGPKTKKLWLSIVPVQRPSEQPGLGPTQKGVNCNFFDRNSTSRTALESFLSRTLKYGVSAGLPKR